MDEEKECRVCREDEDSAENPLYAPCLCSGSILFCHENCLVEWLKRSGKDYCELCKTKYVFQPKYASNTPETLPQHELMVGLLRMIMTKFVPQLFRIFLALVAWLIVMPCVTSAIYRSLVFSYKPMHPFVPVAPVPTDVGTEMSTVEKYTAYVYKNTVSGLLLTGLIVVTFIIMV
jgi:E3 ubiquitin-protein ligase DOA10